MSQAFNSKLQLLQSKWLLLRPAGISSNRPTFACAIDVANQDTYRKTAPQQGGAIHVVDKDTLLGIADRETGKGCPRRGRAIPKNGKSPPNSCGSSAVRRHNRAG
jgi:hypothetical protein